MYRIGFGNDIHRLAAGGPLVLGGVAIPSEKGAVGHSDADALTHAVTDAILGALALGDIGTYFSDKDEKWSGADSFVFLAEAMKMMAAKGFEVENVDSTVSLESPKLRPFVDSIRLRLAECLMVEVERVSVKAKTAEGFGAVGRGEAIRAEVVILLKENPQ